MRPYTLECTIPNDAPNASVNILFYPPSKNDADKRQFTVQWQQDADSTIKSERFWTLSEAVAHKNHMVTALNIAARSNNVA